MSGQLELKRLPWPRLANLDLLATLPWDSLHAQSVVRRFTKPGYMWSSLDRESLLPLDPRGLELLRFEVGACFPGMLPPTCSSLPLYRS